ncbi:MAG: Uma2 family endonuclease, partial [Isosphaeraceae bacterium]
DYFSKLAQTIQVFKHPLRIIGPDGQPFPSHQELMDHAEAERQRAERLAARLRELGIEPD